MLVEIVIDGSSISYLEHDTERPLLDGGVTKRASWILPCSAPKRVAFCILRRVFGDTGVVSDWTRSWRGSWMVDLTLSGGPVVSGFSCREAALRYEEKWVMRRIGLGKAS